MTELEMSAPNVGRKGNRPEAAAINEVLRELRSHPWVAWVQRINSSASTICNDFVHLGFFDRPDASGKLRLLRDNR